MPRKGEYSGADPQKKCVMCGNFFFRRYPSGNLLAWHVWDKKRACGPRCAAAFKWQQRQEAKEVSP